MAARPGDNPPSPFVFVSERGTPFTTAGFAWMIERVAIGAGLEVKVHPHMLRHACGYALANKGHDTRAIQGWLGHRSITSTAVYTADLPTKTSRLLFAKPVDIPIREHGSETDQIIIRLYKLPIEEWSTLPRKVKKNDLQIFNSLTVSMLRNDREVFAGAMTDLTTRHAVTHWYRIQIAGEQRRYLGQLAAERVREDKALAAL
jgi:hypothetical protein